MRRIPVGEAALLAVYFEETTLLQAEQRAESERQSRGNSPTYTRNDEGMDTDDVIGGSEEIDFFEAKRRGLI